MAAQSIAKLAIHLTADTSSLQTNMNRAQGVVRGFDRSMSMNTGTTAAWKNQVTLAAQSVGAFRGQLGSIASLAGRAGPIALLSLALGAFIVQTARAADAVAVSNAKIARDYEALFQGIEGRRLVARFSDDDTWAAGHAKLKAAVGETASIINNTVGDGIAGVFAKVSRDLAAAFDSLNEFIKPAWLKNQEEFLKSVEARTKAEAARIKAQDEQNKKAAELVAKWREDMKRTGERLSESLRTPAEIFADTMHELNQLHKHGFIDDKTFSRGIGKAKRDLMDATASAEKFRDAVNPRVGAVEQFTTAGFSAAHEGRDTIKRLLDAQKEAKEIEKAQLAELREGNRLFKERPPVKLTAGAF